MRRGRPFAVVVLAAAVATGACGSGYTPNTEARRAFVDAQASALCAVKARTFPNEQALEAAYRSAQRANISDRDARALKKQLEG